jgi:hypothetical protein
MPQAKAMGSIPKNVQKYFTRIFIPYDQGKKFGACIPMLTPGGAWASGSLWSSGVVVVIRGLTWKADTRKRKKYFSLHFESDKNGQSKRTGYL